MSLNSRWWKCLMEDWNLTCFISHKCFVQLNASFQFNCFQMRHFMFLISLLSRDLFTCLFLRTCTAYYQISCKWNNELFIAPTIISESNFKEATHEIKVLTLNHVIGLFICASWDAIQIQHERRVQLSQNLINKLINKLLSTSFYSVTLFSISTRGTFGFLNRRICYDHNQLRLKKSIK